MKHAAGCLVIAGSSGVGKSTLILRALERNADWIFSVSATTRKIRPGETDGHEYYFLDRRAFEAKISAGEFLEYADVYGNLYGTLKSEINRAADLGKHLLIEVDTVGCLSIRALRPEIQIAAIVPPSLEELKRRLRDRGTETEQALSARFLQIMAELQRMRGFDYAIVNDDLETATEHLLTLMAMTQAGLNRTSETVDLLFNHPGGQPDA